MFEDKSGILLISGLGFFMFAFLSNAVVPILMYRHLPEKTAEQVVNQNLLYQFEDLSLRYPEQFQKYFGQPTPQNCADALRLGNNARAALITRGLAEITRLGTALGARPETFMGLTGVGDLLLTCTGDLSRNRMVGLRLGEGVPLARALADLGHVAEGVWSAPEVARRAREVGVEMPITQAVCTVLADLLTPQAALERLLARDPRREGE